MLTDQFGIRVKDNATLPFSPDNLLRELDQRRIIDWALELKNGPESYAFLLTALREGKLKVNQTRNALHALFRIRGHGDSGEIMQVFLEAACHVSKEVRSEAVQLAIGLVRLSRMYDRQPLVLSTQSEEKLRKAVAKGLSPKVTALAADFFNSSKPTRVTTTSESGSPQPKS